MNPTSMLEDEVAWLGNFVPSIHPDMSDTDNSLLAGHLKLISTLLTCEGVHISGTLLPQGYSFGIVDDEVGHLI